jgi:hypothetical protein
MAHFAKLDENNVVVEVVIVRNEDMLVDGVENEQAGIDYLESLGFTGRWVQTSYNATFRKNYAAVGQRYDEEKDAFMPTPLYPSWILNQETFKWEAPVPKPAEDPDGFLYYWDEETMSWIPSWIEEF